MIWRLRLHQVRKLQERALRWMSRIGMVGMLGTLVLQVIVPSVMNRGAMLLAIGLSVLMFSIAYALGEGPSLREYAEGDSDEIPGIAKLLSGLVASVSGVALIMVGIIRVMQ